MAFDAQLRLVWGVSLCLLLVGHSGITRASSEGAGSGPRGEEEDSGSLADRSAQIIRQQDAEEGQVTRTAARTGVTGSKDKTALCSMPLAPTNGRIEGEDSDLSLGGKVHVLCEVGYTLIGPSELTCNAFPYPGVTRGWWQPQKPYACTPEFPVQEPADAPETEIEETNRHLQLGVEDSSFCGEPRVPENGFIEGANFDLGRKVRIRCEPGYTLNGPSLLTCEAVPCHMCGHGLWTPQDEYSCTRSLSAVESNMVELHSLNQDRWNEPGPRYTVLRQESNSIHPVRAQLDSGEDVKCRAPTPPVHGHLEGTDYILYATVTIVCDPGYNLLGQDHIACLPVPDPFRHIGIWEPQEMPICRADPPSLLPAHLTENSAILRSPLRNRVILSGPSSNQVEGLPSVCSLPKVVGPCKAAYPRFYFDRGQMECLPFTYGGCRENANNFETLEECQHACR